MQKMYYTDYILLEIKYLHQWQQSKSSVNIFSSTYHAIKSVLNKIKLYSENIKLHYIIAVIVGHFISLDIHNKSFHI